MRIGQDRELGQLTYCTNIHRGESWSEVRLALSEYLPKVKALVSPEQPFGVGLRLGAAAVDALGRAESFAQLQALLGSDFRVFTLNGFPYGRFHAAPVKQSVYRPDWRDPARLSYTNRLADLLVRLLQEDMPGSISTLPGTYRPWLADSADPAAELAGMGRNLLRHAAHLHRLEEDTGRHICLALEPEPFCLLERAGDAVGFFQDYLLSRAALAFVMGALGCGLARAERLVRRHLGVCLDVCHQSVVFEDPVQAVAELQQAGIRIAKIQLSAALKVERCDAARLASLRTFDDPVYLHQTFVRRGEQVNAYCDLGEALDAEQEAGGQWRCHFHVPVFLTELENFHSTQAELTSLLQRHRRHPISPHLEVETYTWDVLPERYRDTGVSRAIARELHWVLEQLA